ncbi:putative E3 ubiquitin-protein ligase dtx2 [Gryganskiella cystojenkinii]|nr:putative E3 ubiquitin-protein ligase dtx2 [Gryganskiella cystojenkinii]
MALIHTNKAEFSDLFTPFFEDCSLEEENSIALPLLDPTEGTNSRNNYNGSNTNNSLFGYQPPAGGGFPSIPNSTDSTATATANTVSSASTGHYGGTRLLNLDQHRYPELASIVANDFYSHTHRQSDYRVESVHILRNPLVWDRYKATKAMRRERSKKWYDQRQRTRAASATDLPLTEEDENWEAPEDRFRDEILFHGTQKSKIASILHNGLDPKMTVRANYGKGLYFSDAIEKCMQYTDTQTTMDQEYSIILCCVILGNVLVEPYEKSSRRLFPTSNFLPPGYDSAVAHDVYKEWIVMEKSHVLPLCVVNFKATNSPDSFFRLSQHSVLFRASGHYPPSIHDIQRNLLVPVPTDLNADPETADSNLEEWHGPDEGFAAMLTKVFHADLASTKVRKLKFSKHVDWLIKIKITQRRYYISEPNRSLLISAVKNIQTLQTRLEADRDLANKSRNLQRQSIEAAKAKIPNCQQLLTVVQDIEPELKRIQALGTQVQNELNQLHADAAQQGIPANSHQFQLAAHPIQQRLASLQAEYDQKLAATTAWTQEQKTLAESILQMQRSFDDQSRMDKERDDRNKMSITIETARVTQQGLAFACPLTKLEMKLRIVNADKDRSTLGFSNPTEKFSMPQSDFQTVTLKSWPQVVAELLMPALMITLMPSAAVQQLSQTTIFRVEETIKQLGLTDVKELWEIAPSLTFSMPMASPILWPINTRRRLANRRLFKLTDYLEWIFLETEVRKRKIQARETSSVTGQLKSQLRADRVERNPLEGLDLRMFLSKKWEELDPRIIPAIRGLLSRTGSVVFDRKAREAEIAAMGANLMENLFITAEPHMLVQDDDKTRHTAAGPSKQPPAECPICQEVLEIPENATMTSPSKTTAASASTASTSSSSALPSNKNDQEPDRVVKLRSCRHCFHESCISHWFKADASNLKCPLCQVMCTTGARAGATKEAFSGKPIKLGPSPDGTLGYAFDVRLACYFLYVCIPGHYAPVTDDATRTEVWIKPENRYMVIPFTARLGPLLMIRTICLFYYGHLFKVGRSLTRDIDNVVTWNGVHMRTAMTGAYGFPAPVFEESCWDEINLKGVAMGLDDLLLEMPPAPVPLAEVLKKEATQTSSLRPTVSIAGSVAAAAGHGAVGGLVGAGGGGGGNGADPTIGESEEDRRYRNTQRLFSGGQHYAFRI